MAIPKTRDPAAHLSNSFFQSVYHPLSYRRWRILAILIYSCRVQLASWVFISFLRQALLQYTTFPHRAHCRLADPFPHVAQGSFTSVGTLSSAGTLPSADTLSSAGTPSAAGKLSLAGLPPLAETVVLYPMTFSCNPSIPRCPPLSQTLEPHTCVTMVMIIGCARCK